MEAKLCSQEAINLKQGQEHAALLEHHSRLKQNCCAMQNEYAVLQQAYAAMQESASAQLSAASAQLSAALSRASIAEAGLASTLEVVRTSSATSTAALPLAAQVRCQHEVAWGWGFRNKLLLLLTIRVVFTIAVGPWLYRYVYEE